MKMFLVFALALIAVASAVDPVKVVDNNNPGGVHVVDNNPYAVNVVDNNNAAPNLIPNPDSFFYQGGQNGAGRPDISPAFVNPPYPYNHDNPYLRDGQ